MIGAKDPMETAAAQLDLGFQAANATMLAAATAWHAAFRANIESAEAARRIFGGLLLDWHQRFFLRPGR